MVETFTENHNGNTSTQPQLPDGARLLTVAPPAACGQPISIMRLPDVMKRVGLKRATIYLHIAAGTFPKQISLGPRAVGWVEHEIDTWLAARVMGTRGTENV